MALLTVQVGGCAPNCIRACYGQRHKHRACTHRPLLHACGCLLVSHGATTGVGCTQRRAAADCAQKNGRLHTQMQRVGMHARRQTGNSWQHACARLSTFSTIAATIAIILGRKAHAQGLESDKYTFALPGSACEHGHEVMSEAKCRAAGNSMYLDWGGVLTERREQSYCIFGAANDNRSLVYFNLSPRIKSSTTNSTNSTMKSLCDKGACLKVC